MSRMYTHWRCDNCDDEHERYVSFGHGDDTFDYKWECKNCSHINTLRVYGEYIILQSGLDATVYTFEGWNTKEGACGYKD